MLSLLANVKPVCGHSTPILSTFVSHCSKTLTTGGIHATRNHVLYKCYPKNLIKWNLTDICCLSTAVEPPTPWKSCHSSALHCRKPSGNVAISKAYIHQGLCCNKDRNNSSETIKDETDSEASSELRENIWTIPNLLTVSRIGLTPVLGYCVLNEYYPIACGLFVYAGITDLLDGWIARTYPSQMSSFGSFLDPLADKLLISTLFITLTAMHLIPVPLTVLIIARDAILILAAFYIRYISLPPPKTLQRYFDASHVTSNLQPLFISKLNTAVQLILVAVTLGAPVFSYVDHVALQALWYITAGTTFASGIGYMVAKDTFKIYKNGS